MRLVLYPYTAKSEMKDNLSFYESSQSAEPVSILSVPLELGSDERGHAATPKYLREHGLEKMLVSIGREVAHRTAIHCLVAPLTASAGAMKHGKEVASVVRRASLAAEKAARAGNTIVALGGDHSIAMGSIAGAAAAHPSLGVIYIDAHPDCNTDETTITGNVHGMVMAALMGHGHQIFTDIVKQKIAPENVLFIGLKDFDQAEIDFLREHKVSCITMLDIAKRGTSPAFSAIDALARRVDRVWVSMDMDSIGREYAPGVGLPNEGGLTRREITALAHYIGKSCRVAGLDIVEIISTKDVEGKTAQLAIELIARFLGAEYSWYQQEYIETYRETNVTRVEEKVEVRREQGRAM